MHGMKVRSMLNISVPVPCSKAVNNNIGMQMNSSVNCLKLIQSFVVEHKLVHKFDLKKN